MSTHSDPHDTQTDPDPGPQTGNPADDNTTTTTNSDMQPDNDNSTNSAPSYRRVGRVEPTEDVVNALGELADEFILADPPETVGGNINDFDAVRACLAEAVEYFHQNLPDDARQHLHEKWGIQDSMINARKIGYVDDTNDVIDHLVSKGFDKLTITRAGLGTEPVIKHLFECGGVSSENAEFVPDDRRSDEVDNDCTHTVDETIETLVRAQLQGLIQPEEIDLEAVAAHLEANRGMTLWNWWNNRITFPYRDSNGDFCYLIVRATDGTDDIIYNNGITDRTDEKCTPVSDTRLGANLLANDILPSDDLTDYLVLPFADAPFKTPDEDDVQDDVDQIVQLLIQHTNDTANVTDEQLLEVGLVHDPAATKNIESQDTARIHLLDVQGDDEYEADFLLTPAATGIEPGANVTFVNHTSWDAEMQVAATPDGVWWDGGAFDEIDALDCTERGMYRYEVHVNGNTLNGIIVCFEDVYTERRNYQVEQWVSDEPEFGVDMAKYIKQTIDRVWINHDAIVEPIFGCETVHAGKPLIVTEGVTDAIVAHQNNFPCVAPATTNFKQHHYDKICDVAEDVSTVFIVNDNEVNNAGVNGALRTAKVIENDGHDVLIGELPRPADKDKIDVADYLKNNTRDAFIKDVLQAGIPPGEHELFDPERHDPAFRTGVDTDDSDYDGDYSTDSDFNADDFDASNASALYSLSLEDVINFDALDIGGGSGRTIYRGEHPIQHHGSSTGYFVIRNHGEFISAKDYKIESEDGAFTYNALTWLACAAECDCDPREHCDCTRTPTRPMGSLSNSEVWWAWKHAKAADHIPFPDDDPVPVKAIWFLAEHHDVIPEKYIPDSFDDEQRLPPAKYNEVLEIIEAEYDLDPGRTPLRTSEE